jgi:AraC-like DNA-binding protein
MKDRTPKNRKKDATAVADRCKAPAQAARDHKISLHALARSGYPGQPLGKQDVPGLLSVGFWDVPSLQQWGLGTHTNEGIELTFLETGKLAFQLDKKFTLKPGHMTITRPWQPHALGDPNITPGRLHWIIFDVGVRKPHQKWQWPDWLVLTPADLKELTILLRQNETPIWSAGNEIANCFKKIAELIQSPKSSLRISRLTILLNELFISLYEMLKKRQVKLEPELTTSYRTVELFLESLRGNRQLLCQQWNIDAMADYCHLGVTHFTRLCKTVSNMTPMQYLNSQRIDMAIVVMQENPELSITDVAFRCGFNSSQYFATVFKRFKGCNPNKYRH